MSGAASFGWPMLLLAVATPFILHRLGLERYGAWALINALLAVTVAFSHGLGDGTVKLVAEYHTRRDLVQLNHVLGVGLALYGALGLCLGAALAVATPLLMARVFVVSEAYRDEVTIAMWLATAALTVNLAATPLARIPTALQRYEWAAAIDITFRTLMVAMQVAVLWWGYALVAIALAALVLTVLRAVAHLSLARYLVSGLRPIPAGGRAVLRRLLSFSFYGACIYLGGQATQHLDRLLLGVLVGPAAVAYYVVPQAIASRLHLLLAHTGHFLFPLSSALAAEGGGRRLAHAFHLATRVASLGALALALPLILAAGPLLTRWLGADFAANATPVLQWLLVAYALLSLNIAAYYVLQGTERPHINAVFSLLTVVGVVIVSVTLVPRWHLTGVAVGLALYQGASSLTQLMVVQRHVLGRPLWELGRVLSAAGGAAVAAVVVVAIVAPAINSANLLLLLSALGTGTGIVVALGLGIDRLLWGSDALVHWLLRLWPPRGAPKTPRSVTVTPRSATTAI